VAAPGGDPARWGDANDRTGPESAPGAPPQRESFFRHDGPFWRGLASFGATHAPEAMVRYSPPAWAALFAAALPDVRIRVLDNLRRVRGPRPWLEEQRDVLLTFSHFASCLTEALALGGRSARRVDRVVRGGENLKQALGRGRGIVMVTAHTGAWETSGPLLKSDFSLDVIVAMQREPDVRSRRIQDAARSRSGVRVVHVGEDPLAVLPLLTHLRGGGVVGVQIDRAPRTMRALPVDLFGRPAKIPSGPFQLARATGAPVLPVFTRRLGYFRYEIQVSPPIQLSRAADGEELASAAQTAASEMERFIREDPTHWFHFDPEG
jgi:lauroyl/myristoyl acyltransferase